MTLLLTLERGPHQQSVRQMRLDEGALVIGRSADADWRIDDPDSYVSRSHCTVTGRGGSYTITDTSSAGLFIDNASRPLGSGNTAPLRDGMLLRLGDYVLRVEMRSVPRPDRPEPDRAAEPTWAEPPKRTADPFDVDGFFSTKSEPEPSRPRPPDLPDPFDAPARQAAANLPPARKAPPLFDDPFTLDPVPSARSEAPSSLGGFDWDAPAAQQPSRARERPAAGEAELSAPVASRQTIPPKSPQGRDDRARTAGGAEADVALAAFMRGLGLDAADAPGGDAVARLEALGREYRLMAEGLMQLLRMRAREKGNARIAQTVVGSAETNPLKFMPTIEDALAVMLAPRSPGFSDAEGAIIGAVRDLAGHQVGSWRGIQAALRRMIDRFDPKLLEAELERLGLLETLLAGGRRAKLWELYEKRFREIAEGAETRFLGEVGADFRDAYEAEEK